MKNQNTEHQFFTCFLKISLRNFPKKISLMLVLFCVFNLNALALTHLGNCISWSASSNSVLFKCDGGEVVKLQIITPEMVRVRVSPDGNFPEALTVKFGFVKDNWPVSHFKTKDNGNAVWVETGAIRIKATKQPFRLTFFDNQGKPFLKESETPGVAYGKEGVELRMEMTPDEHFYGMGFQRGSLDARGRKLEWKRLYRMKEATMGYFMSTRGYGFYSNNTWRQSFDFTEKQGSSNYYSVSAEGGQLDYYIIIGPGFRQILERYTDLTGRPWMIPRWALGLLYICRCYPDENLVRNMVQGYRERDIPLDMIGLEPGWDDVWYGMTWKWHPQRFPNPKALITEMAKEGIKMEVWESGKAPTFGYLDPGVRNNWYAERVDASLKSGIKFFKQDDPYPRMIQSTGMEDAKYNDPLGNSGQYNAAETENLANSLYSETALSEARRITEERAMIIFHAYCASFATHRWPFSWAGDFAAGAGMLNAGMTGHAIASLDMQNQIPGGMHKGFLNPISIIDAWAYYREPWVYTEPIEKMNKFYAKLKYRLIPYIYTTVHQATAKGIPTTRAMIIDNENNPELVGVDTQYMLGDWLLAGSDVDVDESRNKTMAATWSVDGKIYLPRGTWFNYWTGEKVESTGGWMKTSWPDTVGGPLFAKGGAIIPMAQVAGYSDQEPLEVVVLDVYPSGNSDYTLYEDDGLSYQYEKDICATTLIRSSQSDGKVKIEIGERKGNYQGMPERRSYLLSVHVPVAPKLVRLGGQSLLQKKDKGELLYTGNTKGWYYDDATKILWIKPIAGWRYDYDKRGPEKDVERDYVVWDSVSAATGGALELSISLPTERELNNIPKPFIGQSAGLRMFSDFDVLVADGISKALLSVEVIDSLGRRVSGANNIIELSANGEGTFENGTQKCTVQAMDGVATAVVMSTTKPGNAIIKATSINMKTCSISIGIVRGTIELKANPPVPFKVGSWPPDNVTIYATVKAGNQIVQSYNQPMTLHVSGLPEGIVTDFGNTARKGIATFSVAYKIPPTYTFHVTGPGLEPAKISIY